MLKILNREMRMPALAAAACAAVILVASPVSAATYTSGDYRTALMAECNSLSGRTRGNCVKGKIGEYRTATQGALAISRDCTATRAYCDSLVEEYWDDAYMKRFL